jgi:hypothetical protein|tara:strand:+ start:1339 stop:1908 length:570 start_codon:yes stop_codon:yes gene_type:complete
MNKRVGVNDFVFRQKEGSGKSYTNKLSFQEIADHADHQMELDLYQEGYRKGVRIIDVDSSLTNKFICPFVRIEKNTKLLARYVQRREDEDLYIQIRAQSGEPLLAGKVELILYHHDVLSENNEQTTDFEWELISFHAVPKGIDFLPMGPVTMMRNQHELPGGTKAKYSSEDWAKSVEFWQQYAALDAIK